MFDFNHPFFIPLWRRVAVTLFCLIWSAVEFATGSVFWGILFGGLGLYCIWGLFIAFEPPEQK